MVPRKAVKQDLKTETNTIVYMPLATKYHHGVVKIGDGLVIDNDGLLSFDRGEVSILKIAKNGVEIQPDENKLINIVLNKIDVGLNNVDNTSDENKPLSKAARVALDEKLNIYQGVDNFEKVLMVGESGEIELKKLAFNIDKDVVGDLQLKIEGDNFNLIKTTVNLKTFNESQESIHLPLADDTKSGLMSVSDYRSIRDLQTRVGQLEHKPSRLLYDASYNPSAEEINDFVTALGFVEPFEGIAVVVEGTNHIWYYYDGGVGWKDAGLDVVSNFTNEIAGVIKGSAENGKVFAETDGTGSVYGWDDLTNVVTGLTNDVVRKTDYASGSAISSNTSPGIVNIRQNGQGGISISTTDKTIITVKATHDVIDARTPSNYLDGATISANHCRVISPSVLDYAVKKALSDNKLTTTDYAWTDAEKESARLLLGAAGSADVENKLDKVETTSSYQQLYAKNQDGTQTMMNVTGSVVASTIVQRLAGGAVGVGEPTQDYHAVPLGYANNNFVKQVEYSTGQTFADGSDAGVIGRLYMRFRDDTENSIVAHCQAMKYTVPVRDSGANFYVGDPTQPYHCANVKTVTSLTGTAAPTESTKALFVGQFYHDTTNNKTYQCTFIDNTNKLYSWVQLIRSTDYAGNSVKGVVDVRAAFGMGVDQWGRIYNVLADETTIAGKTDIYKPITANKIDYAVKQGLAYSKLEGSGYAWTEDEKASARELLGITQSGGGTSDYDELINKPKINGVELVGYKTSAELGLLTETDLPQVVRLI